MSDSETFQLKMGSFYRKTFNGGISNLTNQNSTISLASRGGSRRKCCVEWSENRHKGKYVPVKGWITGLSRDGCKRERVNVPEN